jgi:hypothetical protein
MEHNMEKTRRPNPVFQIEQVAIYPRDPARAKALLSAMGLNDWVEDHVVASGSVHGRPNQSNEADLSFNYQGLGRGNELEVLHYTTGRHWMRKIFRPMFRASHLGMHVNEQELQDWRLLFQSLGIPIAQEVRTSSHTNPVIAGKRKYHYVIFDTYPILGIDIKFIVRHDPSDF